MVVNRAFTMAILRVNLVVSYYVCVKFGPALLGAAEETRTTLMEYASWRRLVVTASADISSHHERVLNNFWQLKPIYTFEALFPLPQHHAPIHPTKIDTFSLRARTFCFCSCSAVTPPVKIWLNYIVENANFSKLINS